MNEPIIFSNEKGDATVVQMDDSMVKIEGGGTELVIRDMRDRFKYTFAAYIAGFFAGMLSCIAGVAFARLFC